MRVRWPFKWLSNLPKAVKRPSEGRITNGLAASWRAVRQAYDMRCPK